MVPFFATKKLINRSMDFKCVETKR